MKPFKSVLLAAFTLAAVVLPAPAAPIPVQELANWDEVVHVWRQWLRGHHDAAVAHEVGTAKPYTATGNVYLFEQYGNDKNDGKPYPEHAAIKVGDTVLFLYTLPGGKPQQIAREVARIDATGLWTATGTRVAFTSVQGVVRAVNKVPPSN